MVGRHPFLILIALFTCCWAKAEESSGLVDTHIHIMASKPPALGTGSQKQEQKRPSAQEMRLSFKNAFEETIKKLDRYGIEKALVVVVPGKSDAEKEYLPRRALVAQYQGRFGLMAGGAQLQQYLKKDPDRVTAADRKTFKAVAEKLLEEGAVGFGEMIAYHLCLSPGHSFQRVPADHPLYLVLADLAAENDVPIDLHMEVITERRKTPEHLAKASRGKNPEFLEPSLPGLEALLKHNRKARIVWQHIGWDNTGEMTLAVLQRMLESHPNLFMALRVEARDFQVGAKDTAMPNRIVDKNGKIKAAWLELFKAFPDRFVIGSDNFFYPGSDETNPVAKSFDETWSMARQLPKDLRTAMCRDNAVRIYALGRKRPEPPKSSGPGNDRKTRPRRPPRRPLRGR